jgi:hypothetical protein
VNNVVTFPALLTCAPARVEPPALFNLFEMFKQAHLRWPVSGIQPVNMRIPFLAGRCN